MEIATNPIPDVTTALASRDYPLLQPPPIVNGVSV